MRHFLTFALCVLVFFGFGACDSGHNSPEACAETFMKYVYVDGKADKAMDMLRNRDSGKPFEGKEKEQINGKINSKIAMITTQSLEYGTKVKSAKSQKTTYIDENKTKAVVSVQIQADNGESDSKEVSVKLVDGKWYVVIPEW